MKYIPGCKKCKSVLEETTSDGFLLGFLWCPKCKAVTTDVIALPIVKLNNNNNNKKALDFTVKVAV